MALLTPRHSARWSATLLATVCLIVAAACSDTDDSASRRSTPSTAVPSTTAEPGSTVPTPPGPDVSTTSGALRDGCFVQLFEGDRFTDVTYTLSAVGRYPDLAGLPGTTMNWTDEADSIKVGAAATVTIWEDTGFHGASQVLQPGSEHPDLAHEPSSLELVCS